MDEIQSAYWNATSITLHPVVAYYKDGENLIHRNIVFVSDLNHHNSTAVVAILRNLIPMLQDAFFGLKYIHYWTDSPSSQYVTDISSTTYTITSHYMAFLLTGIISKWDMARARAMG
jgi:hypothetical protein